VHRGASHWGEMCGVYARAVHAEGRGGAAFTWLLRAPTGGTTRVKGATVRVMRLVRARSDGRVVATVGMQRQAIAVAEGCEAGWMTFAG
jgi:hypothetical protein